MNTLVSKSVESERGKARDVAAERRDVAGDVNEELKDGVGSLARAFALAEQEEIALKKSAKKFAMCLGVNNVARKLNRNGVLSCHQIADNGTLDER